MLVVIDSLRSDYLGTYGFARPTSPTIDALAKRSTVFTGAVSVAPWTRPAVAALLTGMYPETIGLTCHNVNVPEASCDVLSTEVDTLAEVLSGAGFETAGFVANIQIDQVFGFDQGFETYEHVFTSLAKTDPRWRERWDKFKWLDESTELVTDAAIGWLRSRESDRPFLLYIHYLDPHFPHTPPEPFRSEFHVPTENVLFPELREAKSNYAAEIRYVDSKLSTVLDELRKQNLTEQTIIVLTSDHGECFAEHGIMDRQHGYTVFENQLRIPLLLSIPGIAEAGVRVGEQVSLIDIMPTLLDVLELPAPSTMDGRSLVGALHGEAIGSVPVLIGWGYRPMMAVREPPWKLIQNTKTQSVSLFNLETDPRERKDAADSRPDVVRRLRLELHNAVTSSRQRSASFTGPRGTLQLSPEQLRELERLGYVD